MPRLIKRYGSRKLYDTSESRYVGLDDIAGFVRAGETVRVVDNRSGDDVTAVILTQVISEEGRSGAGTLSPGFLHDLLRVGEQALRLGESAVEAGIEQARTRVDTLTRRTVERLRPSGPLAEARDEMDRLRARLEALESTLHALGDAPADPPSTQANRDGRR